MNIKEEQLCRLCFGVAGNEFEVIDEITRQMLDILPVKINLDVSESPTVCRNCSETVKRFYIIKGIGNRFGEALTKKESTFETEEGSSESIICRFCISLQSANNLVCMDVLVNEPMFREIWSTVMEMEPDVIKKSLICTHCKDHLEHYLIFVRSCWDTEEKINLYCQRNGTNNKGKVNLSDVQYFLFENALKFPNKCGIKQEVDKFGDVNFEQRNDSLKHEELHIKEEAEENSCQNLQNIDRNTVISKMYKCEICTYKTKYRTSLKYHELTHKDNSEVEMHECTMCTYKTKRKAGLKQHSIIHKNASELKMYKCALCPYQTKRKGNIPQHVIIHQDPSKVEVYKCTICPYSTIRKYYLNEHMLVHKEISEVEICKYGMCAYDSRHKNKVTHKLTPKEKIHKCTLCSYETKHKGHLQLHMVIHKDASELEMYKCPMCIFETKYKQQLKRHLQIHQDTSGVELYNCTQCSYVARHKFILTRHMSVHKEHLKVDVNKCSLCTFETRYKSSLNRHMRTHNKMLKK